MTTVTIESTKSIVKYKKANFTNLKPLKVKDIMPLFCIECGVSTFKVPVAANGYCKKCLSFSFNNL